MAIVTIEESFLPLPTEQDVFELDQQLGRPIPFDYRDFLLKHNGGSPTPECFHIRGNRAGDIGIINWFYGLTSDEDYDIREAVLTLRERIPAHFLPIGDDPGGNQLCISLAGEDAGTVYFWDHENEVDEGEVPGYQNVYFVASSFGALLSSLFEYPELDD